jgi:parallel beta-helix repeat protein
MTPDHPDHAEPSNTPPTADRRALLAGIGGLAAGALLVGSNAAHAGPLNPPAGPITSTPGPEPRIAISPTNTPGDTDALFVVSQPGSYYLSSNITGVAGKHGIKVTSSGVTIDLNGFDMAGVSNTGSFHGIVCNTAASVHIRNGSVRRWGGSGIDLTGTFGSVVTDIRAIDNINYGIRGSNRTVIRNCVATGNAGTGLRTAFGGVIEHCLAATNGLHGIELSTGCYVFTNQSFSNGTIGEGAGIFAAGSGNRIEGNKCDGADKGIEVVSSGNFIVRNTCTGNAVNWVLAGNNIFGPILDRTTPSSAAVSGSSASSTLGSTDANANFSY